MQIDPVEHPVSMQIFGSEPDLMAEVAKSIEEQPFDILDINMGCPVPKVVNNGEGSALLKNPELIREIVTKVSHAVKKPVTAKIRIGFEGYPVDPVEIAKIIEDSGAAAVAVHGRTRQQYYAGEADWDTIRRIKEAVSIPVIGNGDVDSPKKAEALVRETGCDGIMIGRAVRGNPWIFQDCPGNRYSVAVLNSTGSSPAEHMRIKSSSHLRAISAANGSFMSNTGVPRNSSPSTRIFSTRPIGVLLPSKPRVCM